MLDAGIPFADMPSGQFLYLQEWFPEAAWLVHSQGGIRAALLVEGRQPVAAVAVLLVSEPIPAIRRLIEVVRHAHTRPDADGQGNLFDLPARVVASVQPECYIIFLFYIDNLTQK